MQIIDCSNLTLDRTLVVMTRNWADHGWSQPVTWQIIDGSDLTLGRTLMVLTRNWADH